MASVTMMELSRTTDTSTPLKALIAAHTTMARTAMTAVPIWLL